MSPGRVSLLFAACLVAPGAGCVPTAIDGDPGDRGPVDCQDCGDEAESDGEGGIEATPGVASAGKIDPDQLTLEVNEVAYLTMWLVDPLGDLVPTTQPLVLTSSNPAALAVGSDGAVSASQAGTYMVTGTLRDDEGREFQAVASVIVAEPEGTGGDGGGGDGGGDGGGGCDKWQGDGLCHAGTVGDQHCTGTSAANPGDYMRCDADGCGVKWTNIGPCPDGYFPE